MPPLRSDGWARTLQTQQPLAELGARLNETRVEWLQNGHKVLIRVVLRDSWHIELHKGTQETLYRVRHGQPRRQTGLVPFDARRGHVRDVAHHDIDGRAHLTAPKKVLYSDLHSEQPLFRGSGARVKLGDQLADETGRRLLRAQLVRFDERRKQQPFSSRRINILIREARRISPGGGRGRHHAMGLTSRDGTVRDARTR